MTQPRVDGRTARWAGHREQRRAEFVEAAIAVIDRVGADATVDDIAQALGVTRQTIYRQFDDRRDLNHAIAERAAALLVADVLPRLDGTPLADVQRTIVRVLNAYLDYVQAHPALYRFVRAHEAEVAADSAVRRVKETFGSRVAAIAAELATDLELPVELADTAATGLVGMADAVVSRWLDDPRRMSRKRMINQLALLLGGAIRGAVPV